ncbi:hypothetical protein [Streptomyces sp. NPDC047070]|uniref:hypothetical protein n=1 Tax=Streptomyces sp. NPDC047070 TaxID=3154923 RepID=UPI003456BCE3
MPRATSEGPRAKGQRPVRGAGNCATSHIGPAHASHPYPLTPYGAERSGANAADDREPQARPPLIARTGDRDHGGDGAAQVIRDGDAQCLRDGGGS